MAAGVHVQVVVDGIEHCPATAVSETFEVTSLVTDSRPAADGGVVGELTIDHEAGERPDPAGADRVFDDGDRSVYRFTNESGDCPCGRVPDHGCPVRELRADSGSLHLSFVAPDVPTVKRIVTDLRSCADRVHVRRMTRSTDEGRRALLVVERAAFTDRQYEVLRTAHEMGYFDSPRLADSADVAAELDISQATFSEHLGVAQRKLLDQLLAFE